jgi:hypothetical protein
MPGFFVFDSDTATLNPGYAFTVVTNGRGGRLCSQTGAKPKPNREG